MRRLGRVGIGVGLLLVLGVAFALRFYATWGGATEGGEYVISVDSDPYYHLRRLEWLAQNGRPLIEDPFAAAPARFACPWPVGLEYLALGLDRLVFHGERGRDSLLLAAGFLPLCLGLAAVLSLFLVLARATSPGAALAGAALAAVLPAAVHVSAFAAFDHHGLELCVFIALPALADWAEETRRRLPAAAVGALALGGALLLVDGAYLAMGALGLALAWHALRARREPGAAVAFFAGGFVGVLASSAIELAAGLPRLIPHSGRAGIALVLLGLALADTSSRRRRLAGAVVGLLGLALAARALFLGAGYLTASADPITPNIAEALPLWRRAAPALLAAYAVTLALASGIAWRRRQQERAPFLAVAALVGGALGLLQTKYVFLFGLTAPWALAAALELARPRRPMALALAAATILFVCVQVRAQMIAAPTAVAPGDAAFAKLARRLDAIAPAEELYRPGARPRFSVLLNPSLGPRALYLGRRAVTALPFWGTPALAAQFQDSLRALLAPSEEVALAILERLQVRYLLVDDLAPSRPFAAAAAGVVDPGDRALWVRLLDGRGGAIPGAPALGRFRLLGEAGSGADRLALYEIVGGARLDLDPGATVQAHVRSPEGGEFTWLGRSPMPYATEPSTLAGWAVELQVRCPSGAPQPLVVPEAAVLAGAHVASPACPISR